MNGLKRKGLGIALGTVAAALLVTSGQAKAAMTCPADDPLTTLAAPGFTCTLAGDVFSDFTFSTDLGTHALFSINPGTGDVVLTFSRDGHNYPAGVNSFDYMISAPAGMTIVKDTLGVDVSTADPTTMTTDQIMGNNSGTNVLSATNGDTLVLKGIAGDTSQMITLTSTQPAGAQLNTISNDFGLSGTAKGVPEPMSLSLFGLGLLGLGFAKRRRA